MFTAYLLILYIIFASYSYNKRKQMVEWLGALASNHWDLGSIPRSPKILVSIFLTIIMCMLSKVFHHIPQTSRCQVATSLNLMVIIGRPWYSQSTNALDNQRKSTRACVQMGQNCNQHPQSWPITPWFLYSFSFTF